MNNLAILLTCFNRKNKTLASLGDLKTAFDNYNRKIDYTIYLTDDGCTDNTANAVLEVHNNCKIIQGSGSLFWAGGMRASWQAALENDHDGYLLLNDDTNVTVDFLEELFETEKFSLNKYGKKGVYVGFTSDKETNEVTYGAKVILNRFFYKAKKLLPNGSPQDCDLGNANIMLVPREVTEEIGIISKGYIHSKGDYDYTLKAKKAGYPVLTTSKVCGYCKFDKVNVYEDFHRKNIKERKIILFSPLGLDFTSNKLFMKKHFPTRYIFFYLTAWMKLILPKTYKRIRG